MNRRTPKNTESGVTGVSHIAEEAWDFVRRHPIPVAGALAAGLGAFVLLHHTSKNGKAKAARARGGKAGERSSPPAGRIPTARRTTTARRAGGRRRAATPARASSQTDSK